MQNQTKSTDETNTLILRQQAEILARLELLLAGQGRLEKLLQASTIVIGDKADSGFRSGVSSANA